MGEYYGRLLPIAADCIKYMGETIAIAGLLDAGLGSLKYMPFALPLLQRDLIAKGNAESARKLQSLVNRASGDSKFADTEIKNGYPTTSKHAAVSLWSSIENMMEDILIAAIMSDSSLHEGICSTYHIKKKALKEHWDYKVFVSRDWPSRIQDGVVGCYIKQLVSVRINISATRETECILQELCAARNIIMHNSSRVDDKFMQKCPWLQLSIGDEFSVRRSDVLRYFDACRNFTMPILSEIAASANPN